MIHNQHISGVAYVGKHLTLRGGVIWTRYSRGEDFFGFLLGGIDFLTSKGGYPLDSVTRISKIFQDFPKFSGQGGDSLDFWLKFF